MKFLLPVWGAVIILLNSAAAQTATPSPETRTGGSTPPIPIQIAASSPGKPGPAKGPSNPRFVDKKEPARVPRFTAPPIIDGRMDDLVWQDAAVFGDFLQTQPGDNVAPSSPMEVFMGYDAKHLYVAFKVTHPKDTIRATMRRRDDLGNEDFVGMYLDTFNDRRQAYFIFLNSYGIQTDGIMTEGRGEDGSVDIVMTSKGQLTDDGYIVEAAIPFKSLRYEAGKGKQWGIHLFRRVRGNNNELQSWMPNNRSVSGSLNQAGRITGLEDVSTTRQLEINPSFTLSQTGRRSRFTFDGDPAGRFVNEGLKGEFGMTAKFSITPTTTLDFAYNPDFAQVEADAPVSTANLRFPVFFAEKRPFFLERIEIFESGLQVVNTRAIVDPDIAAKITGRRGKNTFGLMYASDNGTEGNLNEDQREDLLICRLERQRTGGFDLCDNERKADQNAEIGVLRFKRDIGQQNNLGFMATTYNFVDKHNHTAGFDGRWKFDKRTVAEFQIVGSNSRMYFYNPNNNRDEYRTGNGLGYRLWAERTGRNLYMNYLAQGRSPDYRAEVGFNSRYDTNYAGSFIRYRTDQDAKKKIIFREFWNETNVSYDWKGRGQYFITNTRAMLALQRQTFIGANLQFGQEWVYENEFGPIRNSGQSGAFFGPNDHRSQPFQAAQAFIETTPNKKLFVFAFVDYTWGIMEYDFGAGPERRRASRAYIDYLDRCSVDPDCGDAPAMDPGAGNQLTLESTIRYQPTQAFQSQLNFTKRHMTRRDTGELAFDDNLFSSRTTYQFNRNTFARLRLDYSTLNRRLRPQLVVGWTPNPGTALYAGYTDDYSYNGYNPYIRNNGLRETGLVSNGRNFFIKASYLFRKSF